MITISLPRPACVDMVGRLVRAGLLAGLAVTMLIVRPQFEASKECRDGAFNSGFSSGFAVRSCRIVLRRFGEVLITLPLLKAGVVG
jgi:hypothetical protein